MSEMISCHGLHYQQQKTMDMLLSLEEEKPVAFQIFGADPDLMGEAAAIVSSFAGDMIDINMGCPVKKVTKRGAGAALMGTIDTAALIIKNVCSNTNLPVTVKFRAGLDSKTINCVEFAKMAEANGASALTVHGRTWAQGFTGTADWRHIREVKNNVTIPVIGNGDILTHQDGRTMMDQTGCDGVMIGRAALGNPWIFSESDRPQESSLIVAGALEHALLMEQFLPVSRMLGYIKNQLGRYFKGLPGSSSMRKAVYDSPDFTSLKELLQSASYRQSRTS